MGHGPHSSRLVICAVLLLFVLFYVLFVFVLFYVLFVCKCVLYYCHRALTQLQLTNISHNIISYISIETLFGENCKRNADPCSTESCRCWRRRLWWWQLLLLKIRPGLLACYVVSTERQWSTFRRILDLSKRQWLFNSWHGAGYHGAWIFSNTAVRIWNFVIVLILLLL